MTSDCRLIDALCRVKIGWSEDIDGDLEDFRAAIALIQDRAAVAKGTFKKKAPESDQLRSALERCRTVLANMAAENEGWVVWRRWPISHEPLRNDARNLLPVIDRALKSAGDKC